MKPRIVILGAGFGGLELSTRLSETFGDRVAVTLIDRAESFVFGFSKLDVMFGRRAPEAVRLPYQRFVKPGVRFVRQTVTAIDPEARRVTTDSESFDADYLVVALGADYDLSATPGLAEAGNVFYTVAGGLWHESARPLVWTLRARASRTTATCGAWRRAFRTLAGRAHLRPTHTHIFGSCSIPVIPEQGR